MPIERYKTKYSFFINIKYDEAQLRQISQID